MKLNSLNKFVMALALLAVLFASFGVAAPVFAQDGTPVVPEPEITVVVPDTGGDTATTNDGFFLSGWSLLIILGVVVVVLLIALLARSGHTHV
jgi:hypothetical protein